MATLYDQMFSCVSKYHYNAETQYRNIACLRRYSTQLTRDDVMYCSIWDLFLPFHTGAVLNLSFSSTRLQTFLKPHTRSHWLKSVFCEQLHSPSLLPPFYAIRVFRKDLSETYILSCHFILGHT